MCGFLHHWLVTSHLPRHVATDSPNTTITVVKRTSRMRAWISILQGWLLNYINDGGIRTDKQSNLYPTSKATFNRWPNHTYCDSYACFTATGWGIGFSGPKTAAHVHKQNSKAHCKIWLFAGSQNGSAR